MLEQTLTKGEQVLVKRAVANKYSRCATSIEAMREETSAKVAELAGRNVIAFLIANHVDPDLAAEIYVLDGPPKNDAGSSNEPDLSS